MLAKRGLSLKIKGDLFDIYVRKMLLYGSETRPMKFGDMQRVTRTERSMIRRMAEFLLKINVGVRTY
jgi:hypothetical protein